jgi:hypothetical protein
MRKFQVTLADNNPEFNTKIPIAVSVDQNFIQFEAEGFNACGAADEQPIGDGNRSIVAFEIWEGRLRLLVWADINQEDPTHTIDLEEARTSNRDCYYCGGNCHRDPEHACDGYLGDIDNLYKKEKL